jgi:hypothetical protein
MLVQQGPVHSQPSAPLTALLIAGLAASACSGSSGPDTPPVNVIEVSPQTASREVGQSLQYSAVAKEADGTEITGLTFEWVTTNPSVATVTNTGLVTAAGIGTTSVQASAGGKVGSAMLSIEPPIGSITITPEDALLGVGKTLQLTAEVEDQNGVPVTRTIDWVSTSTGVASVNLQGLVSGLDTGTTTIIGSVGTKSDAVNIRVVVPCSTLLSETIQVGESRQGEMASNDCPLGDGTFLDGWRVTVTANTDVQIDLVSTDFDAYLFLLEEQPDTLIELGQDDDGGGGTNARINITLEAGKIYHVLANALDPQDPLGGYTLTLTEVPLPLVERAPATSPRVKTVVKRPLGAFRLRR